MIPGHCPKIVYCFTTGGWHHGFSHAISKASHPHFGSIIRVKKHPLRLLERISLQLCKSGIGGIDVAALPKALALCSQKNTSLVLDGLNVIEVTLSISEAVSLVQEVPLLVVLYKPPDHWVLPSR